MRLKCPSPSLEALEFLNSFIVIMVTTIFIVREWHSFLGKPLMTHHAHLGQQEDENLTLIQNRTPGPGENAGGGGS
jgi:hypothetical protein